MRPTHRLRSRTRRRLTWLAVVLLTWHQLALAAYACAMTPTAPPMAMASAAGMAMSGTCASMGQGPEHQGALCQAHCHPDRATQPDARTGSVPPSALAALPVYWPEPALIVAMPSRVPERFVRLRAPPPPATLLYCSLLI